MDIKFLEEKMKKSKLIYLLFFLFIIQTSLIAQKGEIWGNIYNGSADSSLVADMDVQLLVYRGHALNDDSSYVKKTNTRGKYWLTNLPVDSSFIYYPSVNYHDIIYYGNGVRITNNQFRVQSDVVVYDTTSEKKNIFVPMEHLFLTQQGEKILVKEIFLFQNQGNKTYLGQKANSDNVHYVLEFPLPSGSENLEILSSEAQNSVTVENNTIYETDLLPPGSRQFSYQLQVPYSGNKWQYVRPVIYPTGGVNVFVSDPNLTIEGPGVMPMGDFQIKGKTFQYFSVKNLMPGMQLELTLINLPGKTIDIKWIILFIVLGFLILGFGYTFLKR